MNTFIGREQPLRKLHELDRFGRATLVVIKGRRRIGKSRLLTEYAKDKRLFAFSGLAPIPSMTAQTQRDAFARQFSEIFSLPPLTFLDWSDAFNHLSRHISQEPTVILLDEISWMGDQDPSFVPKLKAWWDLALQAYHQLILVFCGSVSTWIEKNIIHSTAFFGRITLSITLEPFSLSESAHFLKHLGFKGSNYEIFKILCVTGGVPWYLEQIIPNQMADYNIKRLCFEKEGLLTLEFDKIFHDLFNGKGSIYKKIVSILAEGLRPLSDIRDALDYSSSGTLSDLVKNLITAGFITQHTQWSLKTGHTTKNSLYRLRDPYLRFYIKYIEPHWEQIQKNNYQNWNINQLPGWDSMMGFQIENLLLNNRACLLKAIDISPSDIVFDNPYRQNKTTRQKGCQIDYLIQTRTQNLFICEFKFNRKEIDLEIIEAMQKKIDRFSVPRGFSKIPILFHFGGVSAAVDAKNYFYRIIDISDFLH